MTAKIKVGDAYLEITAGTLTSFSPAPQQEPLNTERPEEPEPLEKTVYVYRTNDPFQSSIDQMRAITSIGPAHKTWVKRTWFVVFVIMPLIWTQFMALRLALDRPGNELQAFLYSEMVLLPFSLCYYLVWRRCMRPRK